MAARRRLSLLVSAAVAWLALSGPAQLMQAPATETFAALSARLSEPSGYFDTDNLISNERSYLHVIPALAAARLAGGVYVGVGPDQNFSYIARIRPARAFIIDIRRDNLLLHLLFKALFELAETRVEYLSLLFGRAAPAPAETWRTADARRLASYIDGAPAAVSVLALRARVDRAIAAFGMSLSAADQATIDNFHRRFIEPGLGLRFQSAGRAPSPYYPTYRDLLLETDRQGHLWNYLGSEDDYQFLRSLERRNLIVPIVGNLAGPTAIAAIGREMAADNERLAAFYASNVEFYLFRDGSFPQFIANLSKLPRTDRSLIIRSVFAGGGGYMPADALPGYVSASMVQGVGELVTGFANGRFRQYWELIR